MNTASPTIKLAYIQAQKGAITHESTFKAWDGFRKRGIPCELFDQHQVYERTLPLRRDTLVAGGVPVVEAALATLGITVPPADNLPDCLARYRGRKVWHSTWGELRARFAKRGPHEPLFVKPLRRNKGFPAVALFDTADLPDPTEVADA